MALKVVARSMCSRFSSSLSLSGMEPRLVPGATMLRRFSSEPQTSDDGGIAERVQRLSKDNEQLRKRVAKEKEIVKYGSFPFPNVTFAIGTAVIVSLVFFDKKDVGKVMGI